MKNSFVTDLSQEIEDEVERTVSTCTQCGACTKNCDFLQRYGSPFELAELFRKGDLDRRVPFSCSLCSFCTVVCPEKLDPSRLFWLMRCRFAAGEKVDFRPYRALLNYERLGVSRLLEQYILPDGCTTIFSRDVPWSAQDRHSLSLYFKNFDGWFPVLELF